MGKKEWPLNAHLVGRFLRVQGEVNENLMYEGLCIGVRKEAFDNGQPEHLVWYPPSEPEDSDFGEVAYQNLNELDFEVLDQRPQWANPPAGHNSILKVGDRVRITWQNRPKEGLVYAWEAYVIGYHPHLYNRVHVLLTRKNGGPLVKPFHQFFRSKRGDNHKAGHRWNKLPQNILKHIPGVHLLSCNRL